MIRLAPPLLLVKIEEKIDVEFQADGTLYGEVVCTGSFELTSLDAKAGLVSFRITPKDPRFKHKVHPNLSKKAFEEEDLLTVRSPSRRFSLYHPTPLLKWQLKSNSLDSLPVSLFSSTTHSTHGTR